MTESGGIKIEIRTPTAIVLISLFIWALYQTILTGQFVWDDEFLIVQNSLLNSVRNLPKIFTTTVGVPYDAYRPIQIVTYMIDHYFWGLRPAGYHLTNILIHMGVAVSFYFLVLRIYKKTWAALLASMLFAAHPVHTEAVAYISGRADPLSALFLLLSFLFYFEKRSFAQLSGLGICYGLALLTREGSIVFPFLVLFYHFCYQTSVSRKALGLVAIMTVGYVVLRFFLNLPLLVPGPNVTSHVWERLPGAFAALGRYWNLLLVPENLHMEYGKTLFKWSDPSVIVGVVFLLIILPCMRSLKTRRPVLAYGLGWFFLSFLCVSNIYPLNAYMAEHWLYFPSMGIFLMVPVLVDNLAQGGRAGKISCSIMLLCLFASYSYTTVSQLRYWQDPIYFYERTIRYNPGSFRLYYNLGNVYAIQSGDLKLAVLNYQKAIAIEPKDADAYHNLGQVLNRMGKSDQALESLIKSTQYAPQNAVFHRNLAEVFYQEGLLDQAARSYAKARSLGLSDEALEAKLIDFLQGPGSSKH